MPYLSPRAFPGGRSLRLAALLLCASLDMGAALAQTKPLVIRLSHVVAEDTPKGLAADRFKVLVGQRSGGRIRVVVYPDAALYGDKDEVRALRLGAVELIVPSLSKFGRIGFPEFELFDLPFFFENAAEVRRITHGPMGRRMLDGMKRKGLVGLGYFDNGFKQMSANKPLLEPADFAGLRMRIQSSRVIAAQFRALHARPVALPFSETRRALAAGIVDGTENPMSNFQTQHMEDVQTDLSLTRHGYLGYAIVTSDRFWSSLDAPDRELIAQALSDAADYGDRIADTQDKKALAALREAGSIRIHELTPGQRARLRAAVQPAYDELTRNIGPDWMSDVRKELGR